MKNEILERLDKISDKVGQAADRFWPELVSYEFWSALVAFIIPTVLTVGASILFIVFKHYDRRYDELGSRFDRENADMAIMVFMFAAVICMVVWGFSLTYVPALLHPEAEALKELIRSVQ